MVEARSAVGKIPHGKLW